MPPSISTLITDLFNLPVTLPSIITLITTDFLSTPRPAAWLLPLSSQKASDHNALHAAVLCDATLPLWALPHYALPLLRSPPIHVFHPHLSLAANYNLCDIFTTRNHNMPSTCRTVGRYATPAALYLLLTLYDGTIDPLTTVIVVPSDANRWHTTQVKTVGTL